MPESPARSRYSSAKAHHTIAWVVLLVLSALLFARSYQCWGHPIIDLGRDLSIPAELRDGRVLYRDVTYNYGPLAPYTLAAVTAVLGDDLWVFAAVGVLTGLATMAALYAVGMQYGGIGVGFASAALFAVLNFFAWSTFGCNFVMPYSYAATFGAALVLWSFYFLNRYLGGRRSKDFVSSVALLYLTFLTKQEFAIAIGAVHLIAWCTQKITWKAKGATVVGGVCLAGVMLAIFSARSPEEHSLFSENLLKFSGSSTASSFFESVAGLDQPVIHLADTVSQAGILIVVIFLVNLLWTLAERFRFPRLVGWIVCLTPLLLAMPWLWRYADDRVFSAAPLVALGTLCLLLVKDRRDPLVLLSVLVIASAIRTPLTYGPQWYGFALCLPAYPFAAYLLTIRLAPRLPGPGITVAGFTLFAVLLVVQFDYRKTTYSLENMTDVIETPKGTLYDFPIGRAAAIQEFLDYVTQQRASKPRSMVAFPEGVSLNYFSSIPNPTGYDLFIPPEISSPEIEQRMISELQRTKPECVVITSRDITEFGYREFGGDYARGLGEWIAADYEIERVFPAERTVPWRLYLFRRKP